MSVTFCLGDFASRLRRLPQSHWKAELDRLPETCNRGCSADNCREVCADYARMQWKMLAHKQKVKKTVDKPTRGGKDRAAGE